MEKQDVIAEIKSSGDDKDFIGNVIELLKYNGHYIAFPWSFDGRIMWYRKDLFDAAGIQAPPESFDEFRADAGKLTKDGNYGFAFAGADSGAFQTMLSFMINNGGGFFNTEGKPDLMNVRNVETLKLFSDMVKVDKSINPACVGYNADDMSKIFGSGKCAMMISNPGIIDKNHVFPGLETDIEIKPYE